MLLAVALPLLTAACQTTDGAAISAVCAQFRGIGWSQKDTPQTIDEVKASNARQKAFCAA
jgi:hypothetical protein